MKRLWPISLGSVSAGLLVASLSLSCSARPIDRPAEARLILLYATCTVNRDHLSPYNSKIEFTPNLAKFGRSGVVFRAQHTEAGQSGVAFASLFSGRHAPDHGVFSHPTRISDDVELISEAFAASGWETFFWADHPMASPDLDYDQGVEASNVHWIPGDPFGPREGEHFLKAEDPDFSQILDRLERDPNYKAFVLTNFTVTHAFYSREHVERFCRSYASRCEGLTTADIERYRDLLGKDVFGWMYSPAATKRKFKLSAIEYATLSRVGEILYQSNISYLDELFGALVERIREAGMLDHSAIVFTADHGEVLHRGSARYHWTHGFQLAPEVITVPFLLRAPGLEPKTVDAVTRSVDVFPTLAALAGISPGDSGMMGVDLLPALRGDEPMPALLAYSHTALAPDAVYEGEGRHPLRRRFPKRDPESAWVAVRDADLMYKLTSEDGRSFSPSVYDWRVDRDESNNLYDPSNPQHEANLVRLREYKARLIEGYEASRGAAPAQPPAREQEKLLRSLGYIE